MYPNFGKIGVICGGLSSERDISLSSGDAIYAALIKEGMDAQIVDLTTEFRLEVEEIIKDSGIDIAFIAMHGKFGEDGKLQAILEEMDIPYVGSDSLASAFAMDKIASRRLFAMHNIPVPNYLILNRDNKDIFKLGQFSPPPVNPGDFPPEADAPWAQTRGAGLSFPFIVKPQSQGSSIGISLVRHTDEIDRALDIAFDYNDNIIIEEYIKGKELTVGILENRALTPIEIIPKNTFFDFQAKYSKGLTEYILPASIDLSLEKQIQYLSLKAHKALGCRHFSRVDLLLDQDNNPFILEVNTIPGFTSSSLLPKAALFEGITFTQLCIRLLEMSLSERMVTFK